MTINPSTSIAIQLKDFHRVRSILESALKDPEYNKQLPTLNITYPNGALEFELNTDGLFIDLEYDVAFSATRRAGGSDQYHNHEYFTEINAVSWGIKITEISENWEPFNFTKNQIKVLESLIVEHLNSTVYIENP